MNQPSPSIPPQTLTIDQAMALANQFQSQGKLQDAEQLLQKILQQQPAHAFALHLLGVIAFQVGKLPIAAELVQKAIALNSAVALFHANMCEISRQLKQLDKAIAHGERAIALDPDMAMAHSNLGIALFDLKQYDKAEACQQRALTITPDFSASLNNLGSIWRERGDNEKALDYYRKSAATNPNYLEPLNNLGALLLEEDRTPEAEEVLAKALQLHPGFPDAICNMGGVHLSREENESALEHYRRALSLRPTYVEAQMGVAKTLQAMENLNDAEMAAVRAIQFDENNPKAHALLAGIQTELSKPEQAEAEYERALQLKPDSSEALLGLGHLCTENGQLERARELFERAIEVKPDNFSAHIQLVQTNKVSIDDPHFAALQLEEQKMAEYSENRRMSLHFALGKCYDDIKAHDKAFPHYLAGCQIKRARISYDPAAAVQQFSELKDIFTKDFIDRLRGSGDPSAMPIFVLGMPRSGTTLTEQIIASQPDVFGAGELPELLRIAHRKTHPSAISFPDNLRHLDSATLNAWGAEYVAAVQQRAPNAKRITDKMPANFFAVPLIHLMLPNAKIIHVNRNPVDTCLSCFTRLFHRKQEHTYDLAELGHYYADYARLMDHWRAVLPADSFYDVQYEDIVADQEGEARKLLAYCGLEWNDACLDFHKTQRQVRTASVVQVRQPIYASSVERWRKYEQFLGPLLDELGDLVPNR
ncbi:MAG: tetratricopeptide repeat protein [Gammaproteobacteria bacterium]|nr:tetratricopeptide repeat protein [Gammaproteobacteria bacterium]MBU1625719.1 tetratricopeptide repeat protein [Gammaproteobacteria bacterium]MBU1980979.1 tetratricopeptide repeat protein [Gammaproteobacteria bacterium]